MPGKSGTSAVTIYLPTEHLDAMRARADEGDRPLVAEFRRAVRQYLAETGR